MWVLKYMANMVAAPSEAARPANASRLRRYMLSARRTAQKTINRCGLIAIRSNETPARKGRRLWRHKNKEKPSKRNGEVWAVRNTAMTGAKRNTNARSSDGTFSSRIKTTMHPAAASVQKNRPGAGLPSPSRAVRNNAHGGLRIMRALVSGKPFVLSRTSTSGLEYGFA